MLDDRKLEVLRAIVEDYVVDQRAGRVEGAGRAAPPRRLPGHDPQRHGARWRTRATSPSRTPAPAGCRPTRATGCSSTGSRRSSRCRRRAPRHRDLPARRRRPRRRRQPTVRLLAQLTRQVAVVQYPSLSRSSVRHVEIVHAVRHPAAAGAHHRHRPGRAAGRRAAQRADRGRRRRAAGHPQRPDRRPPAGRRRRR